MMIDEAEFDARPLVSHGRSEQKVNVWYTAPTAIRMLMRAGADAGARAL
jgi:acetyl-CoA synthetase